MKRKYRQFMAFLMQEKSKVMTCIVNFSIFRSFELNESTRELIKYCMYVKGSYLSWEGLRKRHKQCRFELEQLLRAPKLT